MSYGSRLREKYGLVLPNEKSTASPPIAAEVSTQPTDKTIKTPGPDRDAIGRHITETYGDDPELMSNLDAEKIFMRSKMFESSFEGYGPIPFFGEFVGLGYFGPGLCRDCGDYSGDGRCANCIEAIFDVMDRRGIFFEPAMKPAPVTGSTADVESWKDLHCEICMHSDVHGEFWLVPNYTDGDRLEITPEDFMKQYQILEAFPGSRIVAFKRLAHPTHDEEFGEVPF